MKLPFILFFICDLAFAQNWARLPDFPGEARDDGVAVTVNDKAYFGTGLKVGWALTIDFYALDLQTLSWSAIPDMPLGTERQYACAFAGPGCFFVCNGDGVGGAVNNMYKYDIATSAWSAMAPKPGNGLMGAMCLPFGDKVIITGGKYQSGQVNDEVWEYTISSNTWQQKNVFPFGGRWRGSAAVLNGTGYLTFGLDNNLSYRKELYSYNPTTDHWLKLTEFPLAKGRNYAAMQAISNRLVIFGGHDTSGFFHKDSWSFDPSNSTWTPGPDLPAIGRRGGMSCTYTNLFFYSCGLGEADTPLKETWGCDVPVGIAEVHPDKNLFSLYPNPCNAIIWLDVSPGGKAYDQVTCSYTDISGKELARVTGIAGRLQLDVSDLSPGIYFFKIYSADRLLEVKRVIKTGN
jgi:N-acetylneuraminic acid mutarotase